MEAQLSAESQTQMAELLRRKRAATEVEWIAYIPILDSFFLEEMEALKAAAEKLQSATLKDWKALNRMFISAIEDSFGTKLR